MDNKYYELISEIIKNHPKYNNYNDILDDLINDVYSHAEVVITKVEDEETIATYLKKVATTSLITVPKRLNVAKKSSSKALDLISQIKDNAKRQEAETIETSNDVIIPEIEINTDTTLEEFEPLVDEPEETSQTIVENYIEEKEEEILTNNDTEEIQDCAEDINTETIEVNKNLVDLMINGIPDETTTEETVNASFNEFTLEEPEDDSFDFESLDDLESIECIKEDEDQTQEEVIIEENDIDLNTKEEEEENNATDNETNIIEIIDTEDVSAEKISELDLEDNSDIFEELKQENSLDEIDNLEIVDDFDLIEETTTIVDTEDVSSGDSDFKEPEFSCFNYMPEKNKIDVNEISDEIINLAKSNPNLKIVEIFEARYKDNLPLNEIAVKLDIEIELIIEALNELEDIVEA